MEDRVVSAKMGQITFEICALIAEIEFGECRRRFSIRTWQEISFRNILNR